MTALAHLEVRLTPKPHPFPDAPGSSSEAWGEIELRLAGAVEPLLLWQWDLSGSAEWYLENRAALWSARLDEVGADESLAGALVRLQEREFADDDEDAEEAWLDALYDFRKSHSLRFALRGADIPEIIIGCNHGAGEISSVAPARWCHSFDAPRFQAAFERELAAFLADWKQRTTEPAGMNRAAELATRLIKEPVPIASCR